MANIKISDEQNVEPDLTPMLDLVLNVLMFFIATTQFKKKQEEHDIELPTSTQVAITKDESYIHVTMEKLPLDNRLQLTYHRVAFGMDAKEQDKLQLVTLTKDPSRRDKGFADLSNARLRGKVRQIYDAKQLLVKGNADVSTAVLIRAYEDTEYDAIFELLNMLKDAGGKDLDGKMKGFRNLQFRAYRKQ